MKYGHTVRARFLSRLNRFTAAVEPGTGTEELVHVKTTGRCRELLIPGARVVLEEAAGPNRKTRWDLIAVYKDGLGLVNIDSQAPNKAVKEWLATQGYERDGVGYFPDAPTERGVKHLRELTAAAKLGYRCIVAFVIQMEGIGEVRPNDDTHPQFGEALEEAAQAGVEILFLSCRVREDELTVKEALRRRVPQAQRDGKMKEAQRGTQTAGITEHGDRRRRNE